MISGYVDAAIQGAHGVAWLIDLWREGSGWNVDREITLRPNEGEDVTHELEGVRCCDTRDLVRRLSDLVDELLAQPVPRPAAADS
ncbi:MAG TPA: hypothetical protein VH416_02340 [Gaiellaceae bacterium]